MRYDTVILNGRVLTLNPAFDIIEDGAVCIENGVIVRVEPRPPDMGAYPADQVIDAQKGLIMPGLVNAHAHLPMSLFRGLADDLPLAEWLSEHIFPAESRHIDPFAVRSGTRLSCLEMLLSGTTTCCDGYFFEDAVAEAVQETGMRAVLAQGVIDFPAPGVPDPAENVAAASQYVSRWQHVSGLITPSIFCHSPYTCSAETLTRAKKAAGGAGVCFQVHAAETRQEYEQSLAEQGVSPVQYLDRLGVLDEQTLVSHAVWVDKEDIRILASRGCAIAHNPESNMKLASGVAPVPEFIRAGIPVGLGTDGCASNNNLDLFAEMDTAAKLHKGFSGDPRVMDARQVLRMATIEGARALGLDKRVGSIETGKEGDIIVIQTRQPHLTPMYHPESHLVYAVRGADVRDVLVKGRTLVKNREIIGMDTEAILAEARSLGRRIGGSG